MYFDWNDETIETVRRMFEAGATVTQIGMELHTTRNVIAGKVKRLGLKRASVVEKDRKSKPLIVLPPLLSPDVANAGVDLLALDWWHCRAVIRTSGLRQNAAYCGLPKVTAPGCESRLSSYCEWHHAAYHQPRNVES